MIAFFSRGFAGFLRPLSTVAIVREAEAEADKRGV